MNKCSESFSTLKVEELVQTIWKWAQLEDVLPRYFPVLDISLSNVLLRNSRCTVYLCE